MCVLIMVGKLGRSLVVLNVAYGLLMNELFVSELDIECEAWGPRVYSPGKLHSSYVTERREQSIQTATVQRTPFTLARSIGADN